MRYENDVVIYDKFNTILKKKPCSLVEYKTIYGAIKFAIILNSSRTIIFNKHTKLQGLNRTAEVNRSENKRNLKILADYCERMKRISNEQSVVFNTFNTLSEYRLSNSEYIINFPVSMLYMSGNNGFVLNEIPENLAKIIKTIKGTRLGDKLRVFEHKIITINQEEVIFYKMNDIFNKIEALNVGEVNNSKIIVGKKNNEKTPAAIIEEISFGKAVNSKRQKSLLSSKLNIENSLEKSSSQIEKELLSNQLARSNAKYITVCKDNDVVKNALDAISNKGSLEPEKKQRTFIATRRNLTIVKQLKNLYQDKCQICGETFEVSPNCFLSEVHHLKPLGAHNGPDVTENMIVLCPNHHAMFDRGAITIDIEKKIVIHFNPNNPLNNKSIELKHEIDRSYLAYHNANIFINSNSAEYQNKEDVIIHKDETHTPIKTVDFGNIVTLQDMDTSEVFEIKLEDRFNKDFMKPLEKLILQKCLNDIVKFNSFRYKIIIIFDK